MNIKLSRCDSNKLDTIPVVDGQVVYVKDTHSVYFDTSDGRHKTTDLIFLPTQQELEKIENPLPFKLYFVMENVTLYYNVDGSWITLNATSSEEVSFDNEETTLEATTVEDAIKELDAKVGDIGGILDNINGEVI